ncbi:MAG: U32 family peptidase [Lachnospiraceae bacterium]|nr:U32 family peptidase [Lachnospiraceae bacterium]
MSELGLELLAPAGDLDTLKAVIDAGADAVYFGGEMFGARAYAKNFSFEDAKEGIKYAKLHNRKAYLTVNTLVKNKEFDYDLYAYLKYYYEAGIDAFLVQDFGLFKFIKEHFPQVEVHASTQVSTSSSYGANFLKEMGADRVVLSRETSLKEIKEIYDKTKMDIEVFVHGAICVCYSGNCLMSSVLGGRSGNRGRCAQPCRLPYQTTVNGKNSKEIGDYLLSPSDMCLLEHLPELSEAGAFSLKIEGRMKNPTYAAGVTSIYRKYIDLYLSGKEYKVSKKDIEFLKALGQRGGFTDLYLKEQNGRKLMSFMDSSLHLDKDVLYTPPSKKIPLSFEVTLKKGKEAILKLTSDKHSITVLGDIVSEANNRPLSEEDVIKQMKKTGDSAFFLKDISVNMDDGIFMPVSKLNALRRDGFSFLEDKMMGEDYRYSIDFSYKSSPSVKNETVDKAGFSIFVKNTNQLNVALSYVDESDKLILDHTFLEMDIDDLKDRCKAKIILSMPAVFRLKAERFFERNNFKNRIDSFDGFLAASYDSLGYLKENKIPNSKIIIDHRLYTFNNEAVASFLEEGYMEVTSPYELNRKELKHRDNSRSSVITYGRIPLMISANCTRKNVSGCDKTPSVLYLKDRKNVSFPVRNDCSICMNTIYNSLPLDLYKEISYFMEIGFSDFRIDFSTENEKECKAVLEQYYNNIPLNVEATKGHFNRGVE